jgi:hypothetical protein
VREETGWVLDRSSVVPLGWLHFEHLKRQPADHAWPHPDFLNVVVVANASDRLGGVESDWTDTEGFEWSSRTVTIEEALTCGDELSKAFVALLVN